MSKNVDNFAVSQTGTILLHLALLTPHGSFTKRAGWSSRNDNDIEDILRRIRERMLGKEVKIFPGNPKQMRRCALVTAPFCSQIIDKKEAQFRGAALRTSCITYAPHHLSGSHVGGAKATPRLPASLPDPSRGSPRLPTSAPTAPSTKPPCRSPPIPEKLQHAAALGRHGPLMAHNARAPQRGASAPTALASFFPSNWV